MKSLMVLSLVLLVSCASQKEKREIETTASNSNVKSSKQLSGTIHDQIEASKHLTKAQKEELYKIMDENKKIAETLGEQSYQYRAVLVKELLSEKPSPKRVKIIKSDIKRVESLRLKNTFDTVEKVSKIVNQHPDDHTFSEHLIQIERSTR